MTWYEIVLVLVGAFLSLGYLVTTEWQTYDDYREEHKWDKAR